MYYTHLHRQIGIDLLVLHSITVILLRDPDQVYREYPYSLQ